MAPAFFRTANSVKTMRASPAPRSRAEGAGLDRGYQHGRGCRIALEDRSGRLQQLEPRSGVVVENKRRAELVEAMVHGIARRENVQGNTLVSQHARDIGECIRDMEHMLERPDVQNHAKAAGKRCWQFLGVEIEYDIGALVVADVQADEVLDAQSGEVGTWRSRTVVGMFPTERQSIFAHREGSAATPRVAAGPFIPQRSNHSPKISACSMLIPIRSLS